MAGSQGGLRDMTEYPMFGLFSMFTASVNKITEGKKKKTGDKLLQQKKFEWASIVLNIYS